MTFSSEHPDFLASLSDVSSLQSTSRSSCQSRETGPTDYAGSPVSQHGSKGFSRHALPSPLPRSDPLALRRQSAHISVDSIPSTVSSIEDLVQDTDDDAAPADGIPKFWTEAVPASTGEFAELFPSSRSLIIRHDDSTLDGNMNLRIDTKATTADGQRLTITLFHLRMRDLKSRDFSLRRYCRDSGREICHTARKPQKSVMNHSRPHIRRSLSNALHSLRYHNKSETDHFKQIPKAVLKRSDSGYDSIHGDFDEDLSCTSGPKSKVPEPASSDFISVNFSNYAHLDLKRKGIKADKRYEFEYWGEEYQWQRVTQHDENSKCIYSYHLVRRSDDQIVALIVPMALTPEQEQDEAEMGGWVHPCSMRITDLKILEGSGDIAEALVATGLLTLVDDSIRRHFQPRETKQLVIPMPMHSSLMVNMDLVDPKKLINEAFGHHHSQANSCLANSQK